MGLEPNWKSDSSKLFRTELSKEEWGKRLKAELSSGWVVIVLIGSDSNGSGCSGSFKGKIAVRGFTTVETPDTDNADQRYELNSVAALTDTCE